MLSIALRLLEDQVSVAVWSNARRSGRNKDFHRGSRCGVTGFQAGFLPVQERCMERGFEFWVRIDKEQAVGGVSRLSGFMGQSNSRLQEGFYRRKTSRVSTWNNAGISEETVSVV